MKIIVNPHSLELQKTVDVNSGEYNIQKCEFVFSSEYEGLTKMAIFSNEESSFKTMITDNECIIPYEILETDGTIGLGVYGYTLDGEELVKRYSPKPVFFNVELGSYQYAEESEQPSQDIIEQILAELENQAEDIIALQNNVSNLEDNVIPTLATKEEIPTKTSELTNDSNFAYESDIPDVSNFITKDVDNLTYYTPTSNLSAVALSGAYSDLSGTPDLSVYATTEALGTETTNRENADIGLQGQIDAITSSSDVVDIVGTYQDLQNYDTQHLGNNDVIKVLQDSTHNNAMTYYRWLKDTSTWQYIGQEGPYYTKSEIDTTLQGYVEDSDLTNYVQKTDYATTSKTGVIKGSTYYGFEVSNAGVPYLDAFNYTSYQSKDNNCFIGKGTLENVIAGKGLVSNTDYAGNNDNVAGVIKAYTTYGLNMATDGSLRSGTFTYAQYQNATDYAFISVGTLKNVLSAQIGDINTALDTINGEVI